LNIDKRGFRSQKPTSKALIICLFRWFCPGEGVFYCIKISRNIEPGYKDGDILVEICESVVEAKKETGDLRFKTLPEIQAACVFHKGTYGTFSESYETVLRYIEENGYEIAGAIRESYIDGVWNKDDESQWLSEIQVPVRRKPGSSLN